MISINATLVLQVIHIIILIFILNRLMYRPLLKLARKRESYFGNTKNEIRELEEQADKLKLEFTEIQINARKTASQEASQIRGEGMTQAQGHLEETKKGVSSIREEAEREAQKEFEETKPFLGDEAVGLAGEIMERLIGRRVES
ncbi:MAG: hypothetical protein JRG79_02975 [Deltaproteobacteria bacterium]|nr:hypothetical protein [Deltaproteobacteria bacterium]MBW2205845.1 hypothetical protein [Deltaproteobacteria bacterium]